MAAGSAERYFRNELKGAPVFTRDGRRGGGTWTETVFATQRLRFVPARGFVAAEDEAEFACMPAHAIGYVALRHGTRSATRAQIVNMAGIPLIFMGAGPARMLTPGVRGLGTVRLSFFSPHV
jgi:hypothetical protein